MQWPLLWQAIWIVAKAVLVILIAIVTLYGIVVVGGLGLLLITAIFILAACIVKIIYDQLVFEQRYHR